LSARIPVKPAAQTASEMVDICGRKCRRNCWNNGW